MEKGTLSPEELIKGIFSHSSDNSEINILDFRTTPINDLPRLLSLLEAVGTYNDFVPSRVARVMRAFWGEIGDVSIGRNGGPVLYITLPGGNFVRHDYAGEDKLLYAESELNATYAEIEDNFLMAAKASHVDRDDNEIVIAWD